MHGCVAVDGMVGQGGEEAACAWAGSGAWTVVKTQAVAATGLDGQG